MKSVSLYIHIPFCRSKCSYCNFYSVPFEDVYTEQTFINELIRQIEYQMELTGSHLLKTVYIGGGTPSGLSEKALYRLLDYLKTKTSDSTEEFSIECNPEDVTENLVGLFSESPVDRISLGVQSFSDEVLHQSGRRTTAKQTEQALKIIEDRWKGRLNVDIITGLPGQDIKGQQLDIEKAVSSGADHISCYSLIVEDNSRLAAHPLLPDEEDEDEQWNLSRRYLIDQGFSHYEVSNFARPGKESRHNLQYWRMNEYIGCGPGAVGMFRNVSIQRISNPPDLNSWSRGHRENWNSSVENISPEEFLFENFMMGLRTAEGINKNDFFKRFSVFPEQILKETMEAFPKSYFRINELDFSLSSKARLFMNPILLKIRDEIERSPLDLKVNWP